MNWCKKNITINYRQYNNKGQQIQHGWNQQAKTLKPQSW